MVEDSVHGVEGAMRAGMAAIAVGKVAHSDELARLLDSAPSFRCLCGGFDGRGRLGQHARRFGDEAANSMTLVRQDPDRYNQTSG